MKKVFLLTSLLAGMTIATMAQTSPTQDKKAKKETHQKSDSTSHKGDGHGKMGHKGAKKQ